MQNVSIRNPQSDQRIIQMRNNSHWNRPMYQQNVSLEKKLQNKEKIKDSAINYENQQKNFILGWSLFLSQIVICIIHGIFIRPDKQNPVYNFPIFPHTFFIPFVLSIGSTLGLGLLFSYHKKLIISGLGYSLFINAYMLQYYPLINFLWSKSKIFITQQQDKDTLQAFYLSQQSSFSDIKNLTFNHIEGCFRCAMAINVTVSCILGRCGLFQVFVTVLIGGFGYELNHRICVQNFGDDVFGSLYIFAYGGFMGIAIGIALRFKDRKKKFTAKNVNFGPCRFSATLSLLGCAILTISLPFLTLQPHTSIINEYLYYTPTLCILLSISSGFLGAISTSLIVGRKPNIRDFIHGPIAGAIMGGVSSYFTTNLAYCIGVGLIGGCSQIAIQQIIQKRITPKHRPFTTISFSLFGLQGFLASCAGAIGKKIVDNASPNMNYVSLNYNSVKLFEYGLVSSAMGFGFGLIIGVICYFTHINSKEGYFNDEFNWIIMTQLDKQINRTPQPVETNENETSPPPSSQTFLSINPSTIISIPY